MYDRAGSMFVESARHPAITRCRVGNIKRAIGFRARSLRSRRAARATNAILCRGTREAGQPLVRQEVSLIVAIVDRALKILRTLVVQRVNTRQAPPPIRIPHLVFLRHNGAYNEPLITARPAL
jgi:hypothetical protein